MTGAPNASAAAERRAKRRRYCDAEGPRSRDARALWLTPGTRATAHVDGRDAHD